MECDYTHQLTTEQLGIAQEIAQAPPEPGHEVRPDNRCEGDTRVAEVARIMIEGCMNDQMTFGCLECYFFDAGRNICADVLRRS